MLKSDWYKQLDFDGESQPTRLADLLAHRSSQALDHKVPLLRET